MSKGLFDANAAMMVISGLIKDPKILHDQDNFRLSINDFDNEFYKIVFGSIFNLVMSGVEKVEPIDIDIYIAQYPQQYDIYQKNEGLEFIKKLTRPGEVFDQAKFNFHYERLKKFTILRDLEKNGFNTKEFYNPSVALDKRDAEERKINEISSDDIIRTVQKKLNRVEESYVSRMYSTTQKAAEGLRDLYFELKANPEIGLPLEGEILNYILRGARFGKMYINSAPSGHGKAIPNNTIIPTTNGMVKVGEIKVGDYLFDRSGNPTKVLGVYPQGKQENYKITFKDGRTAECNDEHIWSIWNDKKTKLVDYTLKEIIAKVDKNGYKDGKSYRYSVPLNKEVQYNEKTFDIDPYVIGAMLGDGTFRIQNRNKTLYISSNDNEIPLEIAKITGWKMFKSNSENYSYYFKDSDNNNIHIDNFLSKRIELINLKSFDKFIPNEYKFGSIEQRYSLLQGLLDTDGHIRPEKGNVIYYSTSYKMIKDVQEIAHSLGIVANISIDERPEKYTQEKCYSLIFQTNKKSKLFRLTRKKQIAIDWEQNGKRKLRYDNNPIVKIEKLNEKVEMTCFLVDNDEHLFLMNDYIVTHNTRFMVGNACALSLPKLSASNQIEIREQLSKVLFVTTEQQADEIQTLIIAYVSGVNEKKILYGNATKEEEEKILIAIDLIEKYKDNFIIEVIPDPSIALVRAKIVKHILQSGVEFVFYDYIFSSPGLLGEFIQIKVREDVALMMLSNTLKEIAATYNVFIQSATQLNDKWESTIVRNQNHIRGSKAISDKADVGLVSVKLSEVPEEYEIISQIAKQAGVPVPNIVTDIYKNRRGEYAGVKLFRYFDYGTCRTEDIMLTTLSHQIIKDYEKISYNRRLVDMLDLMTGGGIDE